MIGTTFSATLMWLALAMLVLAAHSLVFYPLSLKLFARRLAQPVQALPWAPRPTLALCLCAYNEEASIVAKVERLIEMAAYYGPASVHVYADAPTDATAHLLRRFEGRADIVIGKKRAGKTFGMNLLAARSQSDLILFTDANVISNTDCASELARAFADPAIGCVTAQLVYSNEHESATSAIGALYWRLEEAIKRIESQTVGVIGVDGAMFMIRRSLYQPPPPELIDDLYLSLKILISGARIQSAEHVRVYERNAVGAVEEKQRKRRIACQATNVHRALWPELRTMPAIRIYAYLSHRVMKWLMPFFLTGACICALAAIAVGWDVSMATFLLSSGAAMLSIGHFLNARPFSSLSSAALSLYGVAAGVMESLVAARTYTVWDPALSVRSASPPGQGQSRGETDAH